MSAGPTRYPKQYASIFVFRHNFSSISRTGEREVLAVPTRFSEQCASIFVFRFMKFFFDITISGVRTGLKGGVSGTNVVY